MNESQQQIAQTFLERVLLIEEQISSLNFAMLGLDYSSISQHEEAIRLQLYLERGYAYANLAGFLLLETGIEPELKRRASEVVKRAVDKFVDDARKRLGFTDS